MSTTITEHDDQIFHTFSAIKRKEEAGMRRLYDNYSPALYHQVLKIVPDVDKAQEILQDVFVTVWDKIGSYDDSKSRPYTWMARIARNKAIDYLRSAEAKKNYKTDSLPDYVSDDKHLTTEQYVDHLGLSKVVDNLDAEHRLIIDFLYFRGYTQSEAAKALKLPLGTIKTRSRRALQQLRTILAKELLLLIIPFGGLLFYLFKHLS